MGFTPKQHFPITAEPVLITYRLAGSVPKVILEDRIRIRNAELAKLEIQIENARTGAGKRKLLDFRFKIFAEHELAIEKVLHEIKTGPFYLNLPEVRKIVIDSWMSLHQRGRIYLIALCVMGNHVHVIVKAPEGMEQVAVDKLMKSHKGFTARKANEHLDKTFNAFWSDTYHDRRIRSKRFTSAIWYVLNNPVKAGLVERWMDWPGTFVDPEYVALFLE
ncbi:MAG: REP element-mobilizing transposase RayT [Neolewinella sp.]|jgi:REP element-mobilizing transposase RayT